MYINKERACATCNHCENIDLYHETGCCGPLEGETVLLEDRCICPEEDIILLERLQTAEGSERQDYIVTLRQTLIGTVTIKAISPEDALAKAKLRYEHLGQELPTMDDTEPLEFFVETDDAEKITD